MRKKRGKRSEREQNTRERGERESDNKREREREIERQRQRERESKSGVIKIGGEKGGEGKSKLNGESERKT